jgi:hypothetical protein
MPRVSFRRLSSRLVPGANPCKQAVLALAVLLSVGCGGGGGATQGRIVRGNGYSFIAPSGWAVERRGRELRVTKGLALVSVERFPLQRRYRPEIWVKVVPELDRAAETLARQQRGTVSDPRTVMITGRRARRYDVEYRHEGKQLVERIGFVLVGKTEYLLLCRYESGGDTGACDRLLTSFRLAAA